MMTDPGKSRRVWKRYTVRCGAMVMAVKGPSLLKKKATSVKLGAIKDIGLKGLAIQYIANRDILNKVKHLSIMVPGKGTVIKNIPFTVVNCFDAAELPDGKKIKTLCVAFQNMSHQQKVQLENFIDEYGVPLV